MIPKFHLFRSGRVALAASLFAGLSAAASAATVLTTYTPGEVFIGFRQTGVANTLVAKIGTVRDFLPTNLGGNRTPGVPFQISFGFVPGTSTPVTNLGADLTTVFGSPWASNPTDGSGVRWGIVGWTGDTGESSVVNGLDVRSIIVTRARANADTPTNISESPSAIGNRGGFATAFNSFAQGTGGGSYINNASTANSSVAYIGAASDTNNWGNRINTTNAGFGLGSNRAVDQTGLTASNGPTNSTLDLWLSPNTANGLSTLATQNTYLGSFLLGTNGSLTFTPAGSAPNPQVPVITSSNTANGTVGVPFSYTITSSNNATSYGATLSQALGAATANLSINTSTGLISGIPINSGTAAVPISASNSAGIGNGSLTLTIAPAPIAPPVITSAASANGTVGAAFSFQITASNNATSFAATGLPAGLSINATSGLISGTPTAAGNTTVGLGATNAGGTGNATLAIRIAPAPVAPPVITSAASANGTVGAAFSYQITASNNATSFAATGLPAGLSINATSGVIAGTPATAGNFTALLSASNAGGNGTANFTIRILTARPAITSAANASGTVGTAFSYQISASNNPTGFGATGLPSGLSINATTGRISGTPTAAGNATVTLTATNAGGTGNATLSLRVAPRR